jgi:hypothetical protein
MPKVRALMTRSPLRDSGNEKRSEETCRSAAPRAPLFARQIARLEFTHRVRAGESGGNDRRITRQPPRAGGFGDGRLVIIDSDDRSSRRAILQLRTFWREIWREDFSSRFHKVREHCKGEGP